MTRKRNGFAALCILGCAVLALVACGPADVSEGQDAAIPVSNPHGGNPEEEGEPVRGGTMVIGMDRDVSGFDPGQQVGTNNVASAIYDLLLKFNQEGEPEPYLAESMETTDDGTTWVMGLREGVQFHDDTPLNAEAVMFNVQRHIDNTGSPGHLYAQRIQSMRAVDDYTVEFVLHEPMGTFPAVFALRYSNFSGTLGMIASPAAIREYGEEYTRHPVGAGPYKFVEWLPDNRVVVERNDNYWQEGLPYLDRIEFRPLPDTETRYASVENGDVDMIFAGYHTELVRATDNPDLEVYYGPGSGAQYLSFNFTEPPFDDHRMREAIVRAINLDALSATLYRGRMERARTFLGRDSPYYSQAAADAWPDYDPERARQLVEEYRADGGDPHFTYKSSNAPNSVQFAEFLQAQLADIGIEMQIESYDLAQLATEVVRNRDFTLIGGLSGPWQNPFPDVYSKFHSEGNTNSGGYSNPEMDQVLNQAIATTDQQERIQAYQRAQEIANEDIVAVWYSRGFLSAIAQPEVNGVVRYLNREMFYATLWLDH